MLSHFEKISYYHFKSNFIITIIWSSRYLWPQLASKKSLKNILLRKITLKSKLKNPIKDRRLWIEIWRFFLLSLNSVIKLFQSFKEKFSHVCKTIQSHSNKISFYLQVVLFSLHAKPVVVNTLLKFLALFSSSFTVRWIDKGLARR